MEPLPEEEPQQRGDEQQGRQTAAALSLLQRLPPQDLEANLAAFAKITPHLEQSLAPHVMRPPRLERDPEHNRYFLACDYNADGGAYRSPWSNKYFPPPPGEDEDRLFRPSERLRRLEETFNDVFDAYKTSYYEGGVSSVYLWDLDEGFAGAFLIRKELSKGRAAERGVWDSTHIIEVLEVPNASFVYKLSSTVCVHVEAGAAKGPDGETELSSLVTRQAESRRDLRKKGGGEDMHLLQMGRMIEEMEISIRQSLDSLYMAKQREVLSAVRSLDVGPSARRAHAHGAASAASVAKGGFGSAPSDCPGGARA